MWKVPARFLDRACSLTAQIIKWQKCPNKEDMEYTSYRLRSDFLVRYTHKSFIYGLFIIKNDISSNRFSMPCKQALKAINSNMYK